MVNQKLSEKLLEAEYTVPNKRKEELSDIAEKFYLGELSAAQVISYVGKYSEFEELKMILQARMKATADALCKLLDDTASEKE